MLFNEPKRKTIRVSVKKEVHTQAHKKCEKCGLTMKWGDPRIAFHHTRSPSVSPSPKTVQLLCRNCHAKYGHTYKTVTHTDWFGFKEKETVIKRNKVTRKTPKKTTKKKSGTTGKKKRTRTKSSRTTKTKSRKKK